MKIQKNKLQWLVRGGLGSALTGFGICLIIESAFFKYENPENYLWILYGTISLSVFISGLNILISSLLYRIKMDKA